MNVPQNPLKNCLDHIHKNQKPNGSFVSLAGTKDFITSVERTTPFVTALILCCLGITTEDLRIKKIAQKAFPFLLAEKSAHTSWNYWPKNSEKRKQTPIPDDLDDTFMVLSALTLHNHQRITTELFPSIIKLLTTTETQIGGPYNTWLVPDIHTAPWKDIDIVVNSNIGYFLKLNDINLPNLQDFAEEIIRTGNYTTRYYYFFAMTLYCISRFYTGALKQKAIDYLLDQQKKDGSWGSILDTSLCLSALHNFGYSGIKTKKALSLITKYAETNKFQPFPLYIEESKQSPSYAGSSSLTAAFIYEAIVLARTATTKNTRSKKESPYSAKIKNKVLAQTQKTFIQTSKETQRIIEKCLSAITQFDTHSEVPLLAYHTRDSLRSDLREKISDQAIITLGTANTLGWIAYTLYDDVLDDEADPIVITTANTALRALTQSYTSLLSQKQYPLFSQIMDKLEEANYFERKYCKISKDTKVIEKKNLPEYGNYQLLADKSFGHALSALTVFIQLGYSQKSKEYKNLYSFFEHYIIARQLNDDAHDWQEDLARGFHNPVSVLLLKDYFAQTKSNQLMYPLSPEDTTLQKIFWHTTMTKVAKDILDHLTAAKKALTKIKIITDSAYLLSLLTPIEKSATEAINEQAQMKTFLKSYK